MLKISDIRQYVSDLGIAEDSNVYIGKMNGKREHSIGVYHRKGAGPPRVSLGGMECSSYDTFRASILIHWDRDVEASEKAAYELYEKLLKESSLVIGGTHIHMIILQVPEPVDVGTDDCGVYEYVIWLDFIYQRK